MYVAVYFIISIANCNTLKNHVPAYFEKQIIIIIPQLILISKELKYL